MSQAFEILKGTDGFVVRRRNRQVQSNGKKVHEC